MNMTDTLIATAFIVCLFLGVPILILVIRDRSKLAGGIITRAFGFIVLLSGIAIISLLIYDIVTSSKSIGDIGIKYIIWSIFPVGFVIFGWKWLNDSGPGIENKKIDFESPELVASVKEAKNKLKFFIDKVINDIDGAFIKFPFKTDQDVTEHVWAYVHYYENGDFNVSMVNEPHTQEGEYANRLSVPEKDVEDWQIIYPDGRIKGGFSYIGALKYLKRKGIRFNQTLKNQLKQLIDAEHQL
jgi:uncharacterized protein YegJ (DUF2314 family)